MTNIRPADDPLVYLIILFYTKGTSVVLGNGMKNVVFTDLESHQVREYNSGKKKPGSLDLALIAQRYQHLSFNYMEFVLTARNLISRNRFF